jgi:acyl-CoA synthetase (AMP-forming)/AMP-acid ligase II
VKTSPQRPGGSRLLAGIRPLSDQREVLVKFGISAGAGIEAAPAARRTVTGHILAVADQAGSGAALINAAVHRPGAAAVITWPQFAHLVRAAACGLSRRGLQEGDTAGIFVADAVSHVVAVHAVRAAGGVAVPVCPAQSAADVAAGLKQRRARLLITSAELAGPATQAADRSLVRQVFAFGEAEGTTPFGSLLTARTGGTGGNAGLAEAPAPGLTGADLGLTGTDLGLSRQDVVVAAPPCGDPEAYTSLLDEALAAGATVVAAPRRQVAAAVTAYDGTAAITPGGTGVPGLPASRVFVLR